MHTLRKPNADIVGDAFLLQATRHESISMRLSLSEHTEALSVS